MKRGQVVSSSLGSSVFNDGFFSLVLSTIISASLDGRVESTAIRLSCIGLDGVVGMVDVDRVV